MKKIFSILVLTLLSTHVYADPAASDLQTMKDTVIHAVEGEPIIFKRDTLQAVTLSFDLLDKDSILCGPTEVEGISACIANVKKEKVCSENTEFYAFYFKDSNPSLIISVDSTPAVNCEQEKTP